MPSKIRGGLNDKHMADMHVPRVSSMAKPGGAAFAPTDISGLKAWYKADALALNDNDAVSSWTDSSGNGNHATQGTTSAKPTYKTNIQNGLPAVLSDGGDTLVCAGLGTGWGSSVGSMFIVYNANGDASFSALELSGAADGYWRFSGDSAGYMSVFLATRCFTGSPPAVPTTGANLWSLVKTSTPTYVFRKNAANQAMNVNSHTFGAGTNLTLFSGGAAGPMAGYIMEVILYNTAVSSTDRDLLEAYLNTKWALY